MFPLLATMMDISLHCVLFLFGQKILLLLHLSLKIQVFCKICNVTKASEVNLLVCEDSQKTGIYFLGVKIMFMKVNVYFCF